MRRFLPARVSPKRASGLLLFLCLLVAAQRVPSQVTVSFPETHQVVVLHVPGTPAALQVDLFHLKIGEKGLNKDFTARRILADDGRGWTFSAFVTPARDRLLDAKGFRDYVWTSLQKAPVKRSQMKTYERGAMAMREYFVEEFEGRPMHAMNVFGYLVSGDLWFDVHVSKVEFSPQDQKVLNQILDGVKVIERYQPTSEEYFGYASTFYLKEDWKRAAEYYEAGLALEKQKRALPRDQWRVMVDNLGMAYGMSGNMAKAKTIFEYGLSQEPTYPMFHYNLACAHAEMGDAKNALKSLETAFQYRRNSIPGEGMPDPREDSSFKTLLTNERFQALSKAVCPTSRKTGRGFVCQP